MLLALRNQITNILNTKTRVDYINYIILFYAFSLSFPVHIKTPFIVLLILLWLTDRKNKYFSAPYSNKLFIVISLFIFYMSLTFFWSEASLSQSLIYIKKYWYYIPIFIIFKYLKKEYINYTISAFLLGIFLSEILSYGNFFALWAVKFGNPNDPTVFLNHTQYSIFLSISAIILFFRAVIEKEKIQTILYLIFFTTITTNLFINSGRTGYVTYILVFLLSIFIYYKSNLKIFLLTLLVLCGILTLFYNVSPNLKKRIAHGNSDVTKIYNNSNYNTSIGARVGLWIVAKEIFVNNPLLGTGIAANHIEKNKIIQKSTNIKLKPLTRFEHFHNSFLEIVTQFGLVGLALVLYILYLLISIPIQDRTINIIKISLIATFILGSFSDILFYLNSTMSLFALLAGIILAQYRVEKTKVPPQSN